MTIDPTIVIAAITAISGLAGAAVRMIYRDLRSDRDFWRTTALDAMRHTDKVLEVKNGAG